MNMEEVLRLCPEFAAAVDKAAECVRDFEPEDVMVILQALAEARQALEDSRKQYEQEALKALEEEFFDTSKPKGVRFASMLIAVKAVQLNATEVTHEISGLSYDGKILGDWAVRVEKLPTPPSGKEG